MDTNTTQIEEETFQEALDAMPEEVRDYMWSPAFDYTVDVAQKVLELSPEEKEWVRDVCYDLLMQLIDMETAAKKLVDKKMPLEKVSKTMYFIYQEILQSAQNLVNYYGDINEIVKQDKSQTLPQPPLEQNSELNRINQTFTAPVAIVPTKRVYTDITPQAEPKKTLSQSIPVSEKPSIDPYRLDPNEK